MMITTFTIIELSIACVSIIGAVSMCLKSSKCDNIDTPCCKIHRVVETIVDETVDDIPNKPSDFAHRVGSRRDSSPDKAIIPHHPEGKKDVIH